MSEMAQHPVVRLKDGFVRGKVESGVTAFLGIPYAAPPFGANRMRPPQPAQAWEGERDATAFGPTAPKGDYPPQYAPTDPDPFMNEPPWIQTSTGSPAALTSGVHTFRFRQSSPAITTSGNSAAYCGG